MCRLPLYLNLIHSLCHLKITKQVTIILNFTAYSTVQLNLHCNESLLTPFDIKTGVLFWSHKIQAEQDVVLCQCLDLHIGSHNSQDTNEDLFFKVLSNKDNVWWALSVPWLSQKCFWLELCFSDSATWAGEIFLSMKRCSYLKHGWKGKESQSNLAQSLSAATEIAALTKLTETSWYLPMSSLFKGHSKSQAKAGKDSFK